MARNIKNIARLLDAVNEEQSPEQAFLADLKYSIETTDKKNARKPSLTYKPSSMKCIRSMYYQVTGAEIDDTKAPYTMINICNSGTDTHIRLQQEIESMKENGIDCEYVDVAEFIKQRHLDYLEIKEKSGMETKLYYPKLNMSFMCDGIIRYKGHYYILEIKTETSYKFGIRKAVADEHHYQGTAYSIALQLPEVMFLYYCRDNSDMKTYIYRPTDEEKQELIGKIELSDECIKNGTVPAKPELPKSACTYCGYRKLCEKE